MVSLSNHERTKSASFDKLMMNGKGYEATLQSSWLGDSAMLTSPRGGMIDLLPRLGRGEEVALALTLGMDPDESPSTEPSEFPVTYTLLR